MTLSKPQALILARVKRYPGGIKLDANEIRTARVLARRGFILLDEWTGIARLKEIPA